MSNVYQITREQYRLGWLLPPQASGHRLYSEGRAYTLITKPEHERYLAMIAHVCLKNPSVLQRRKVVVLGVCISHGERNLLRVKDVFFMENSALDEMQLNAGGVA